MSFIKKIPHPGVRYKHMEKHPSSLLMRRRGAQWREYGGTVDQVAIRKENGMAAG